TERATTAMATTSAANTAARIASRHAPAGCSGVIVAEPAATARYGPTRAAARRSADTGAPTPPVARARPPECPEAALGPSGAAPPAPGPPTARQGPRALGAPRGPGRAAHASAHDTRTMTGRAATRAECRHRGRRADRAARRRADRARPPRASRARRRHGR